MKEKSKLKGDIKKEAKTQAMDIVQTIRNPLVVLDSNLNVTFANSSFYQTFNVDIKKTIGKKIYDLGNNQWDIPEFRKLLEKILPNNKFFNDYLVKHNFPEIGEKIMLLNARRLDSIQMILLVIEDITERKKIEGMTTELNNAYLTLKEATRIKENFFKTAAHELKTPLTVMNSFVQLLQSEKIGKINDKQKEILKTVNNDVSRLKDLITKIFDLSRLEEGKAEIKLEQTNIKEIIKNELKLIKPIANKKGIKIKVNMQKTPKTVKTDGYWIRQILSNLLNNSIKFTKKGYIQISSYTQDKKIIIKVKDTGIGISKDNLTKIFTKFFQAQPTETREYLGTGLGLNISQQAIELLGGKISVESKKGKGTTFTFTIPITPSPQQRNNKG